MNCVATGRNPSPAARDVNLVTQSQPSGMVKAFIAWVLMDGQNFVGEAGYITLPKVKLDEELRKLD